MNNRKDEMTACIMQYDENIETTWRVQGNPFAILFVHLGKCGGNTIKHILHKEFGEKYYVVSKVNHWLRMQEVFNEQTQGNGNIAIAGHAVWGIDEILPSEYDAYYFTMLRDPLSIFYSQYTFQKKQLKHYSDLWEFAKRYAHNPLTHALGNGSPDLARKRLRSVYHGFGLVEEFEKTIHMLNYMYNLAISRYTIMNRSKKNYTEYTDEIRSYIAEKNQDDIDLYQWAKKLFYDRYECMKTKLMQEKLTVICDEDSISKNKKSHVHLEKYLQKERLEDVARMIERMDDTPLFLIKKLIAYYKKMNNTEKVEYWLRKLADENHLFAIDLISHISDYDTEKAVSEANRIFSKYEKIKTIKNDTCVSRYKEKLRVYTKQSV